MMDYRPQPVENPDQIQIAIIDQTYAISGDHDWTAARESFRRCLEHEYDVSFEDANIGPSADLPAFITFISGTATIPVWTMIVSAFFLGKPINENLSSWHEVAQKIQRFLTHPAALNRNGAAILAIDAVLKDLTEVPPTFRLAG